MLVFLEISPLTCGKYFKFPFHVYGCFVCIDAYRMCVWYPERLEGIRLLELQMVESHNVGAGNQPLVPWKISQYALNC